MFGTGLSDSFACGLVHSFASVSTISFQPEISHSFGHHFDLTNTCRCQQGQWLLYQAGSLNRLGVLACWEKEDEIKTHTPIGSVAWSVGIVFAADLDADWLFPDLQNLADLKNDRHGPLPIGGLHSSPPWFPC